MRALTFLYLVAAMSSSAIQPQRFAFAEPAAGVRVQTNVTYAASGTTTLAMDVYQPPASAGSRFPALIFFNRATGADRSGGMSGFYAQWAKAAASRGIVGILPDLRQASEAADFRLLLDHLRERGPQYGIGAIAVYAASGNVSAALPALQDPSLTAVRAAVIYYGTGQVSRFRLDLPLLYVRAGLDRPPVNARIAELSAQAIAQNAPVTLLNYAGGHHGFEAVDDNDATRQVIEQTLDFVRQATSAGYHAALQASIAEATVAGHVQTGNFHEAAAGYAALVASRPDDHRLRLSYGEALLRDKQFAAACTELEKLRGKGLGYRDLGLPAAEACLLKGDPAGAVGWLSTIPPQFLPASTAQDARFAALKDRADFQALFKRE